MKYSFPKWRDLPDVDLYMDQVITYLTDKLCCTYFDEDKFITSSMINNYVKTGIVSRPIKKHYTKEHLAYFIAVTILKRCYSMQQISELIEIQIHTKNSSIEQAYDLFMTRFEDTLNAVFETNNTCNTVFNSNNHEQELMDNVIQCIIYKIHTEYVLNLVKRKTLE